MAEIIGFDTKSWYYSKLYEDYDFLEARDKYHEKFGIYPDDIVKMYADEIYYEDAIELCVLEMKTQIGDDE